jgi:hypothetical protein
MKKTHPSLLLQPDSLFLTHPLTKSTLQSYVKNDKLIVE